AFDKFVDQTLSSNHSVRSIEWAPRVRDPDRKRFETRMRSRNQAFPGIASASGGDRPSHSASRQEYYPIEYMYPWSRAEPVAGYDIMSNPHAAPAARRAIATGEPSSTGKLKVWEASGDGNAVITFLAVYDSPGQDHDEEWRSQHCRGLVISV